MRFRPTEAIHLAALAVLTALALLLRDRIEDLRAMLLGYAGLASLVFVIAWLAPREDRLPAPATFLLDFYPAAFMPLLFETLGPLIAGAARRPARRSPHRRGPRSLRRRT